MRNAPLPHKMTIGELYGPAMAITDQAAADEYFARLVERNMRCFGNSREVAEEHERANLGYYAGYGYDRARVERLFRCAHPVFGSVAEKGHPTAEQAFIAGVLLARKGSG
jgi:hypothetical protein